MPYTIQNREIDVDEEPVVRNGRTYVPLRQVAQQLGGNVNWDNTAKQATVTIGQWTARFTPDNTHVDVSGTPVNLQSAPYVEDGELWVPASFFHDAFGYEVSISGQNIGIVNPMAA
jgi:hypothetical protein